MRSVFHSRRASCRGARGPDRQYPLGCIGNVVQTCQADTQRPLSLAQERHQLCTTQHGVWVGTEWLAHSQSAVSIAARARAFESAKACQHGAELLLSFRAPPVRRPRTSYRASGLMTLARSR